MTEQTNKPKFLIVGSMKCGTTGLFNDLAQHPEIFVPLGDKEPEFFTTDKAYEADNLSTYLDLFANAKAGQIAGEASTAYTKAPDFIDVAVRAKKTLGPDVKIIFISRDPIERIISHHHHELSKGRMSKSIDEAVRKNSELINYSKYYYQLTPWIEEFGVENLYLVDFELYKTDRQNTAKEVIKFLGLPSKDFTIDDTKVHNASKNKPVLTGFWKKLYYTSFYQKVVRRVLNRGVRSFVFNRILPKSPFERQKPNSATIAFLNEQLKDDQEKFQQLYKSISSNS